MRYILMLALALSAVGCKKSTSDDAPAQDAPAVSAADNGVALEASRQALIGEWAVTHTDIPALAELPPEEREIVEALSKQSRATFLFAEDGTLEMKALIANSAVESQSGRWTISSVDMQGFQLDLEFPEAEARDVATVEPQEGGKLRLTIDGNKLTLEKADIEAFLQSAETPQMDAPAEENAPE